MPPISHTDTPRRVFVIDDHAVVRRGLCDLLRGANDLEWCGDAATIGEAIARIEELEPSLAVVDLSLDGRSGLELIRTLHERKPTLAILVLSMHEESIYGERALRAGALGYLNKTASGEEILQALRDLAEGRVHLSRRVAETAMQRQSHGDGGNGTGLAALTDRELEVFEAIGQGLGTRQVANKLNLSIKTIESYRERIKEKLGLRNAPELVARAVRYRIEGE
jgi:DNA-binding NarL/FixJ family response regulator